MISPIIGIGSTVEASGHDAKVVGITKEGVELAVEGRLVTVPLKTIEEAWVKTRKEDAKEEKDKKGGK